MRYQSRIMKLDTLKFYGEEQKTTKKQKKYVQINFIGVSVCT